MTATAATQTTSPRLVYDDDCGFCTWSAEWVDRHGDVELVGFSELTPDQRARLPDDWRHCAHLLTDDRVFSCGEAMEQAFALTGLPPREVVRAARRLPGYPTVRERAYRTIADHRGLFGSLVHRRC